MPNIKSGKGSIRQRVLKRKSGAHKPITKKIVLTRHQLYQKIGQGSFSWVFKGRSKVNPSQSLAVKAYFSTCDQRQALAEIQLMKELRGNIRFPQILDVQIYVHHIYIVYRRIQHTDFNKFYKGARLQSIKHYLFQLLLALRRLKEIGFVHRDIKPSNFLYSPFKKRGVLIDFGFAKKYNQLILEKVQNLNNRKGTEGYIPLQVYFNNDYSYASDIWAVGIIMLELLLKKPRIFEVLSNSSSILRQKPEYQQYLVYLLVELSILKDKQDVIQSCNQFGFNLKLPDNIHTQGFRLKQLLQTFNFRGNTLNLLQGLLQLNPQKRIKVQQAIQHAFFDSVRRYHQQ